MPHTSMLMFFLVVALLTQVHGVIAKAASDKIPIKPDLADKRNNVAAYDARDADVPLAVTAKPEAVNKRYDTTTQDAHDVNVPREPKKHPKPPKPPGPPPPPDPPRPKVTPCPDPRRFGKRVECPGPLAVENEAVHEDSDASTNDSRDVDVPRDPKKHPKPPPGPPPPPEPPRPKVTPCVFPRFGKRVQCPRPRDVENEATDQDSDTAIDEARDVNVERAPKKHPKPPGPPPPPEPPRPKVTPCVSPRFGKRVQCPGPRGVENEAVNKHNDLVTDEARDINVGRDPKHPKHPPLPVIPPNAATDKRFDAVVEDKERAIDNRDPKHHPKPPKLAPPPPIPHGDPKTPCRRSGTGNRRLICGTATVGTNDPVDKRVVENAHSVLDAIEMRDNTSG